jgi:hypothetical protein
MRVLLRTNGLTLLEVLVSLQLLAVVLLAMLPVMHLASGATGSVGVAPARLRTLASEYLAAELEYLRSWDYGRLRGALCTLGSSTPFPERRRVPPAYLDEWEPHLPPPFYAAEVELQDEPVLGSAPDGCGPRRITVRVYRTAADAARGQVFAWTATVRAPR